MKKTCVQNGYILVTEGAGLYADGTKESFNLAGEQELSDSEAKELVSIRTFCATGNICL